MKKIQLQLILCLVLLTLCLVFSGSVLAVETDTAGNVLADDVLEGGLTTVNRDFIWVGQTLSLSGNQIGNDALLAGNTLTMDKVHCGGSIRAAGNTLDIKNATVDNNITIAGNSVSVDTGTKAAGVYAAGQTVRFSGESQSFYAAAQTVTLSGKVTGDATINANKIVIEDGAVVTGTLTIKSENQPDIPATASIGHLNFEQQQQTAPSASEKAGKMAKHVAYWLAETLALAAILCLLGKKGIAGAVTMAQKETIPLVISGLVTLLVLPVALIILCITFIGIPLAIIVALVAVALILGATAFAGCTLGRMVFPKWNIWGASLLGAGVLSLVENIPIVKFIVFIAVILFTYGWFIQWLWHQVKKPKASDSGAPALPAVKEGPDL